MTWNINRCPLCIFTVIFLMIGFVLYSIICKVRIVTGFVIFDLITQYCYICVVWGGISVLDILAVLHTYIHFSVSTKDCKYLATH